VENKKKKILFVMGWLVGKFAHRSLLDAQQNLSRLPTVSDTARSGQVPPEPALD